MNSISNKTLFDKYLIFNFATGVLGFCTGILSILCILMHNFELLFFLLGMYGTFVIIFVLFFTYILTAYVNPDYFEASFSKNIIRVAYYRLRRRNGLSFLSLFSYKKNIKSIEVSKDKFEFYAFSTNLFKQKKILHLYGRKQNSLVKFSLNISLIKKSDYQALINNLEIFGLKPEFVRSSKN